MTLEPGTCCSRAVSAFVREAFEQPPELIVVPSFSAGIKQAAGEPRIIVLLPHVHETCSMLTTDPDWVQLVDHTFPFPNPPLVLARRRDSATEERPRCASIERLIGLASAEERARLRFEFVNTTQEAARTCQSPTGPEFCITNQHGAASYGLDVVRILKHMVIWWMPFKHGNGRRGDV